MFSIYMRVVSIKWQKVRETVCEEREETYIADKEELYGTIHRLSVGMFRTTNSRSSFGRA
jgi:hypothetical protein